MKDVFRLSAAATHKSALKIAVIYAAFSLIWISFSDQILYYFVKDSEVLTTLQTIKGWMFIIVTATIVYALLVREISRVKEAESKQRKSEEKYRIMAELTGQMVYDYDMVTAGISWSGPVFEITGWSVEEFPGLPFDTWKNMIHDDDRLATLEQFGQAVKNGSAYKLEYRFRRKNGGYLFVEDSGNFLKDDKGKAYRMLGSLKDISERKLMEKNLLHSQKMEAIGTLAGGIAHDFNNILGAIIGYADLAREDTQSGTRINDNLSKLLGASTRAKDLVRQILAFSRQDEPERKLFQPFEIVVESLKMLRPTLPATINIEQDLSRETGPINADPGQINQIIMNLCTNAFHAMEESGGTLKISLKETKISEEAAAVKPDVEAGVYICLTVSDTGSGISSEIKEKIFTPYFTTKETGKGTGMGLSIVHGIVKSYGGFISVESEPGRGTSMHVYLPVEHQKLAEIAKVAETIPFGNEKILFIDDEQMLTEMGKSLLSRLGYDVTVSNSSIDALHIFKEQPDMFDLVITDQTMPEMTGIELAVKMMQIRADIPVILCSGYSSSVSEAKAREIGVRQFVQKPLTKEEIAGVIRQTIDCQ